MDQAQSCLAEGLPSAAPTLGLCWESSDWPRGEMERGHLSLSLAPALGDSLLVTQSSLETSMGGSPKPQTRCSHSPTKHRKKSWGKEIRTAKSIVNGETESHAKDQGKMHAQKDLSKDWQNGYKNITQLHIIYKQLTLDPTTQKG